MQTIKFYTSGCKANQYDTQSIRERFLNTGFKEIFNGQKADIYLVNTCTVTAKADRDACYYIKKAHRQNPKARIIVTGCLAEKDNSVLSRVKGISYIISKRFFPDGISGFCGHTRAFLKIQDGCDNFCSYCIVPLVRGRSRSRALPEIIREAKALARNGFKEIVLTGICLGAYGQDLKPQVDLVDVVEELEKIEGLLRLRLSSIEAGDVTDALIEKMAKSQKLCRHLHIPMQSGDDEILKKMNRKYTSADYLRLIKKIKRKIPDIVVTTDVLVGFPGENEKNFTHTLDLVRKIQPLKVHIFPYSRREGARAADNFKDEISQAVIKKRRERLVRIADTCALDYQKRFLGKKMKVLFEEGVKENLSFWQGHTDNYIKVQVKSRSNLQNQLMPVRLNKLINGLVLAHLY